jgi:thiamine pyrophosphate-dependent acetolactate synthase large subunit-like protein
VSAPRGPSYLWARREVSEEIVSEDVLSRPIPRATPIHSSALPLSAVQVIAEALLSAKNPLLITSHIGRNPKAVEALVALCDTILPMRVFSACPSTINIPFSNRCFAGIAYLQPGTHTKQLGEADVIVIIDCELPWIEMNAKPKADARIFLLDDGDPLKRGIGSFHVEAELICSTSAEAALVQINEELRHRLAEAPSFIAEPFFTRWREIEGDHEELMADLTRREDSAGSVPQVLSVIRGLVRERESLVLNEGISSYPAVWNHIQADKPGSVVTSGGSALGWSLGAAVGASLGTGGKPELIVSIVGDGTFLFCVPSAAFWMARRYSTVS